MKTNIALSLKRLLLAKGEFVCVQCMKDAITLEATDPHQRSRVILPLYTPSPEDDPFYLHRASLRAMIKALPRGSDTAYLTLDPDGLILTTPWTTITASPTFNLPNVDVAPLPLPTYSTAVSLLASTLLECLPPSSAPFSLTLYPGRGITPTTEERMLLAHVEGPEPTTITLDPFRLYRALRLLHPDDVIYIQAGDPLTLNLALNWTLILRQPLPLGAP